MLHPTAVAPASRPPRSAPLKRKREPLDLDADLDDDHVVHSARPPRKRLNTLEMGFASMSLSHQPVVEACDDAHWFTGQAIPPSSIHPQPEVISCPVIEMADEPPLDPQSQPSTSSDVEMKRSTWYERDKDHIVILDLDSDDEDNSRSTSPTPGEYSISKALLSLLPAPSPAVASFPPESGQLVLYRPSPWTLSQTDSPLDRSRNIDDQDVQPIEVATPFPTGDAMDVEEL